ncbi:hypothetical protein [Hyphomicrobium sp.]|uniref:hypothetical protein n=1 Tax=Hyphomicrobium sp. TaxID=82 RepID=UPI0025B7B8E2|nr:hypothetical protein [Hyphomicrobium sp.]MCC7253912.1 hypothetical protein [Hyphomicrobium sp.]
MTRRGLPSSAAPPKRTARAGRRRKSGSASSRFLKFGGAFLLVGLMGYCISQTAGVAYGEDDIRVVDFSSLTEGQRRTALREANAQRCTCGCGMTLAECVSTDSTCPIREPNIERIKTIVRNTSRR